jgi:hypothetical protein
MSRYNSDLGDFVTSLFNVTKSGASIRDLFRVLWGSGKTGRKPATVRRTKAPKEITSWLNKITRGARAEDRKAARQMQQAIRRSWSGHDEPLPGAAPAGPPGGGPPLSGGGGPGGPGGGGAGGGEGGSYDGAGGILGAIPLQRVVSSNVHAIGYDHDTGTLRVQFHAYVPGRPAGSAAAGPLYDYYDVKPALWKSFQSATSKGKWVWDKLRIRGTISGHRYEYRLVFGTMYLDRGGRPKAYIPRLATGQGLRKRKRIVMGTKVTSVLPAAPLREGKSKRFFKGR